MGKIMIVDDDRNICELLRLYLKRENFETVLAYDGQQALDLYQEQGADLVLLDVMMPRLDGWETCRRLRQKGNVPVIMLTARGETFDKVLGLELGADDYIVKPFDTKEVVARIKAVLRRCQEAEQPVAASEKDDNIVEYDRLRVDLNRYELRINDEVVEAPPKEMKLLFFLASHPNRVYTRDQLLNEVWGMDYYGESRTIDVHIKRLREKLEGVSRQWSLKTVRSVGYKFEALETE